MKKKEISIMGKAITSEAKKIRKLSIMGKAITSEAKKIRKASPKKKWTTCIKEAGKKMKGKF